MRQMLSYQHIYHAGNLADVHKHSLLAWILKYLTQKDKPISYIETHAGRALYDLQAPEALKTHEAVVGITRVSNWFARDHPYQECLQKTNKKNGKLMYPGSPMIASQLLRSSDVITLAELHPSEHKALELALPNAVCRQVDGFSMAHSILPPTPRRGLMLIDPSYEIKEDYDTIPTHIKKYTRMWNVGIIILWYPILMSFPHKSMLTKLLSNHPDALRHEVSFPPARKSHSLIGSGLFIINPPYGTTQETKHLQTQFDML